MLSFGKIILIVVVLIVAMVGFRLVGVMKNVHAREKPPPLKKAERSAAKAKTAELTACPTCGAYTEGPCTKPECRAKR